MTKILVVFTVLLCVGAGPGESGALTTQLALEMARAYSPELRAARLQIQSARKSVTAAGLRLNPELTVEAEGLGWDNGLFGQGEYILGFSQELQLGGKRQKDRAVAAKAVEVADQALLESEIQLKMKVHRAFFDLMVQQEIQIVRAEQIGLAREFTEVAQHRFEAGNNSELDVVQAELALEKATLLQTCCFGDMRAAQEKLASLVGVAVQKLPELVGSFYELETLGTPAVSNDYPGLQRLAAIVDEIRAAALLARASDTANVSLGAGYRRKAAENLNTFVFSVSLPLSLNKQGRAEQAAGVLRANAVEAELDEFRRKLEQELASLLALYEGATIKVEQSRDKLIPKAKRAFEVSREGYEKGRFSWLELIAAQQNLADIRVSHIEYLHDAHVLHTRLTRFVKEGI